MNYADIKRIDVANGPGVRVSLFVSGCTHHCKGCFNQMTWDFHYGEVFTKETQEQVLEYLSKDFVKGLTVLGGEPFEYVNQKGLLPLLQEVRKRFPEKSIWCYTGYDFEQDILKDMCLKWQETTEMLSCLDVLVDGKFIEELKNLNLRFRGSSNQRIIRVPESLKAGRIILWEE
ncbi:anaerobic ribonucleoside-triphosphate reductase activating protein [Anaeromicropila populeti]|uniref:Anaerobic ribonucleoside-triphosphate reductase-activating protein n=1 Tax=Anaeromicropila populeti TaxID=37658 RepID=A0A1I6ISN5_9FIRM|nr:anaerobic ribonucleoside-triphosphate reductase activating protein [Anaeromicropila populeti]SFR69649.1 anaerobic ribonucleoside-triphosphate reductase activating protein [Anaeromicropila populeti]